MKKVNAAVGLLCAALLLLHMLVQACIYGTMHYLKTLSALTANVFGILTAAQLAVIELIARALPRFRKKVSL